MARIMMNPASPPPLGAPTPVRFPPIVREELANGFRISSIEQTAVPLVTVALVCDCGAAADPADRPGLTGLTVDLLDEGAGGRDAIALAEAFAELGTHLETEVSSDLTSFSFTTLARFLDPALALLADIIRRPALAAEDFGRIRELRTSRLRQLSSSPGAMADRGFTEGVFGRHPYGHGALGTTNALESITVDHTRGFHASMFAPARATLIVAGDVTPGIALASARRQFGDWHQTDSAVRPPVPPLEPARSRVLLVPRPSAAQAEVRIGHTGPPRSTTAYHELVTLNAALGGQFSSRINENLREAKGITYGARTAFDFRRVGGSFGCATSVQTDATVTAVAEVLGEFEAVRGGRPVTDDELARAKSALTRGYVRQFETAVQLVRAALELAAFSLPDDTFDRFVPEISSVTEADLVSAAREFIRPSECVTVVVGDPDRARDLEELGREVEVITPEF